MSLSPPPPMALAFISSTLDIAFLWARKNKEMFDQVVLHIYASLPLTVSFIVAVKANSPSEWTNRVTVPIIPSLSSRFVCSPHLSKCQFYRALLEPTRPSCDSLQSLGALVTITNTSDGQRPPTSSIAPSYLTSSRRFMFLVDITPLFSTWTTYLEPYCQLYLATLCLIENSTTRAGPPVKVACDLSPSMQHGGRFSLQYLHHSTHCLLRPCRLRGQ